MGNRVLRSDPGIGGGCCDDPCNCCGGGSGGVDLPASIDMDDDRIYNIGIMGFPIDLDPANPGVPAPPFAPADGSVLQWSEADQEWNAVVVNLELDLHAPKIIVANEANGDTINDGHFLDPGDGTGVALALAAVGGTIPGFPNWGNGQSRVDVWARAGEYALAAGLTVPDTVTLRGGGVDATIFDIAVGPAVTLGAQTELEELSVRSESGHAVSVQGNFADVHHVNLQVRTGLDAALQVLNSTDFKAHDLRIEASSGFLLVGAQGGTLSDIIGRLRGDGIAFQGDQTQGYMVSNVGFDQAEVGLQLRESSTVHFTNFIVGFVTSEAIVAFDTQQVHVTNSRFGSDGGAGNTAISLDGTVRISVTDSTFGEFAEWLLEANTAEYTTITSNYFQSSFPDRTIVSSLTREVSHNHFEGALVVAPIISGRVLYQETLTSTEPGQWYRDGEPIPGATGDTYDVTIDDIGSVITQAGSNSLEFQLSDIPDLVLYGMVEDGGTVISGGRITTVVDQTGTGNDLVNTGTDGPVVETPKTLDGNRAALFEGMEGLERIDPSLGGDLGDFTVMLMKRSDDYAGGIRPLFWMRDGANSERIQLGDGAFLDAELLRVNGSSFLQLPAENLLGRYAVLEAARSGTAISLARSTPDFESIAQVVTGTADATLIPDGSDISVGELNDANGSSSSIAAWLLARRALSDNEKTTIRALWRNTLILGDTEIATVPFEGVITTGSDGQPLSYPERHEGISGDTLQGSFRRLVGFWPGNDTLLTDPGAPPAGSRGNLEARILAGATDLMVLVLVGTNDASSGTVDTDEFLNQVRRVQAVGGAAIRRVYVSTLLGRTDDLINPGAQANVDAYNAALPGLVATLAGEGIPIVLIDAAATFNLDLANNLGDGLHPSPLGATVLGNVLGDGILAVDIAALRAGNTALIPFGDSITAGGSLGVDGSTAGYRYDLARRIAERW